MRRDGVGRLSRSRAVAGARTAMVNLQELSDDDLRKMEAAFERLGKFAERHAARKGTQETR